MLLNRKLQLESLEVRRLLAASCEAAHDNLFVDIAEQSSQVTGKSEGELDPSSVSVDAIAPLTIGNPNLSHGVDLIQEHGNRLFVVDQVPYSSEPATLFIFDRAEDGSLTETASLGVAFPVHKLFVLEGQVLLVGSRLNVGANGVPVADHIVPQVADGELRTWPVFGRPTINVMTVNLGAEISVVKQEFDGQVDSVVLAGDKLVVTGNQGVDAIIAIYPPPAIESVVTTYRITEEGLQQIATVTLPQVGVSQVNGTSFYSAFTVYPDVVYFPPTNALGNSTDAAGSVVPSRPDGPRDLPKAFVSRYSLGEDGIREAAKVELGSGYIHRLSVAENGMTGVAVRNELLGVGPSLVIDLIDFSNDSVSVVESVRLENFHGDVLAQSSDYVVLGSHGDNSLLVVNTNQSLDLAAESRIRRIEFPRQLQLRYESLLISDELLVIGAERWSVDRPPIPATTGDGVMGEANVAASSTSVLLTVSLSNARVVAETVLLESEARHGAMRLLLIDSDTSRFGYFSSDLSLFNNSESLVFGRLNDSGSFVREGMIAGRRWLEVDANADRLLARTSDQLLEFDWLPGSEPVTTPLGEPEPTISAVDDSYTLFDTGRDHFLDVLANDVFRDGQSRESTVISGLSNAPEGAEVIGGRRIRIPASAVQGADSLRFEYTISDGESRSTGIVEIDVHSISEERVREWVQSVRIQAAEDFKVPLGEVSVLSVERQTDLAAGLPNHSVGADGTESRLGLLVTVSVPNATARYGVSLDGDITQLTVSRLEKLLELGLRAVNDAGETLERIVQGQSFWIEFNARDLRPGGRGVFAAFFDLVVPTELLEITGPVNFMPGYSGIKSGSTNKGEVDDLGAIASGVSSPGADIQSLLRVGVRAVGSGRVTLQPEPADGIGTASLLHGLSTEVRAEQARYRPLVISITETVEDDPLDVNGSGSVTAGDALAIINFLNRFGNVSITRFVESLRNGNAEGEDPSGMEVAQMQRLDTSRDDVITALDALMIVNDLYRQSFALSVNDREEESDESFRLMLDLPIDNEEDDKKI